MGTSSSVTSPEACQEQRGDIPSPGSMTTCSGPRSSLMEASSPTQALWQPLSHSTCKLLSTKINCGFSAKGDIGTDGNWTVRLKVRTPDNTLHEAIVKFFTLY